ncbi:predicted protein [Coccidioides posadasii str. Silveira]|uniref:Predicted protein n=1 Tax=Coccidioides posadasii (strain RMSCC 757 / Silveira) TaxID=443226 RepID=E9D3N3_COCPS|nr:predicted protein [Coccidioides posadasii str. Silveira]
MSGTVFGDEMRVKRNTELDFSKKIACSATMTPGPSLGLMKSNFEHRGTSGNKTPRVNRPERGFRRLQSGTEEPPSYFATSQPDVQDFHPEGRENRDLVRPRSEARGKVCRSINSLHFTPPRRGENIGTWGIAVTCPFTRNKICKPSIVQYSNSELNTALSIPVAGEKNARGNAIEISHCGVSGSVHRIPTSRGSD